VWLVCMSYEVCCCLKAGKDNVCHTGGTVLLRDESCELGRLLILRWGWSVV